MSGQHAHDIMTSLLRGKHHKGTEKRLRTILILQRNSKKIKLTNIDFIILPLNFAEISEKSQVHTRTIMQKYVFFL